MGKYQQMLIFFTGIGALGATVEMSNISIVMPNIKCDFNLTTAEQGLLSSVCFLGFISTSTLFGFLADAWGRKKVLTFGAFGGFVFAIASSFATNFYTLLVSRFLVGAM